MADDIKPALTPEEWGRVGDAGQVAPHERGVFFGQRRPGHAGVQGMTVDPMTERHALAALALYSQPFGFTREMLSFLRDKQAEAARGRGGIDAHRFGEITARIAALLPSDPLP